MAKAKDKFPMQLFVAKNYEGCVGDNFFFDTQEKSEGLEVSNGERTIAIYQLVRVTRIVNTSKVL